MTGFRRFTIAAVIWGLGFVACVGAPAAAQAQCATTDPAANSADPSTLSWGTDQAIQTNFDNARAQEGLPGITLPSAVLRSSPIELMGSGIGSIPLDRFVHAIDGLLRAAVPAGFAIAAHAVPLSDVEQAWARDDSARLGRCALGFRSNSASQR